MILNKYIKHYGVALSLVATTATAQSFTSSAKLIACGQMAFRRPASITVDLKNTSTEVAQIKSVDTGCGCSTAWFTQGDVPPGQIAQVVITFDCKQMGHFFRNIRVYDNVSEQPAEFDVQGQIVGKIENYSGQYPFKKGPLLADTETVEFDDVHRGHRLVKEIHIMNAGSQNLEPVALRLPSYLTAEVKPKVIGPKQKGTLYITLNSNDLRDYGLTQSTIYLGKNSADKVTAEKEITVSAVLLPPAMPKDDVKRPYAPKLTMSKNTLDMTALQKKAKAKDEITITNDGKSTLKISKLQVFTAGLEVQLGQQSLEPGESTKLKVTAIAKELKKAHSRPRILMITNAPEHQKVVIEMKK